MCTAASRAAKTTFSATRTSLTSRCTAGHACTCTRPQRRARATSVRLAPAVTCPTSLPSAAGAGTTPARAKSASVQASRWTIAWSSWAATRARRSRCRRRRQAPRARLRTTAAPTSPRTASTSPLASTAPRPSGPSLRCTAGRVTSHSAAAQRCVPCGCGAGCAGGMWTLT